MSVISKDTLMAYADGELSKADAVKVETQLEADPELRAQLSRHHALRAEINQAFDGVLNEPVPDRLTTLLEPESMNVTDLSSRREKSKTSYNGVWPLSAISAIAASLVIGLFIGIEGFGNSDDQAGFAPSSVLATALDSLPSGSIDGSLAIVASFTSVTGEFCRRFHLNGAAPRNGMACRGDAGNWDILALVPAQRLDVFRPAGQTPQSVIDELASSMDPLGLEAEAEYISD